MQLRNFRSSDLQGVYDLACRSLREKYNPSLFLDLSPFWREGFLVMEDMGKIVGFVFGIMVSPIEARVLMLAVSQEQRNKGYGKLLCRYFFQQCSNKGVRMVSLEVRTSNISAQHFYLKMGFIPAGTIKDYYSDGEDGLAMQMFL